MNTSNTAQDLSKAALQSIDELSHAASSAAKPSSDPHDGPSVRTVLGRALSTLWSSSSLR